MGTLWNVTIGGKINTSKLQAKRYGNLELCLLDDNEAHHVALW